LPLEKGHRSTLRIGSVRAPKSVSGTRIHDHFGLLPQTARQIDDRGDDADIVALARE